jgi:hypothetical protein
MGFLDVETMATLITHERCEEGCALQGLGAEELKKVTLLELRLITPEHIISAIEQDEKWTRKAEGHALDLDSGNSLQGSHTVKKCIHPNQTRLLFLQNQLLPNQLLPSHLPLVKSTPFCQIPSCQITTQTISSQAAPS